jgi:methyltransferase
VSAAPPALMLALVAFLAAVAAERMYELRLSVRHGRALAARGAIEHGRSHFALFVVLHALWPVALALEVLVLGARPGPSWPLWLLALGVAQALRFSAIRALGERWTVRVMVLPGVPLVRRGPYRFMRHPNYVAVLIELIAAPLLFGAWRTAIAATALNLVALAIRVRVEERALRPASPSTG